METHVILLKTYQVLNQDYGRLSQILPEKASIKRKSETVVTPMCPTTKPKTHPAEFAKII